MELAFAVKFPNDNPVSFAPVTPHQIVDGTLRGQGKKLVGRTLQIKWNRKIHDGVIMDCGNDWDAMQDRSDELCEEYFRNTKANEPVSSKRAAKKKSDPDFVTTTAVKKSKGRGKKPSSSAAAAKRKLEDLEKLTGLEVDESSTDAVSGENLEVLNSTPPKSNSPVPYCSNNPPTSALQNDYPIHGSQSFPENSQTNYGNPRPIPEQYSYSQPTYFSQPYNHYSDYRYPAESMPFNGSCFADINAHFSGHPQYSATVPPSPNVPNPPATTGDSIVATTLPDIRTQSSTPSTLDAYRADPDSLEGKMQKLEQANQELRKQNEELRNGTSNLVKVGPNLFVGSDMLESMKGQAKGRSTRLARELFRFFFTVTELKTHSLTGEPCNANKKKNGGTPPPVLPALDKNKTSAIFEFVLRQNPLWVKDPDPSTVTKAYMDSWIDEKETARAKLHHNISDFLWRQRNPLPPKAKK